VLTARGHSVDVWILWFDELWGKAEDADGKELLRASCAMSSLVHAVANGAQAVLDQHGVSGYQELWEHDFPVEALKELQALLAQR